MKKQVNIDIPEGKEPVISETERGVVITWTDKKLSYNDIVNSLEKRRIIIPILPHLSFTEDEESYFYAKVNVLRKLVNIRNYFGKPSETIGYVITPNGVTSSEYVYNDGIIFKEYKHAKQAIEILGDELKLLFEPW